MINSPREAAWIVEGTNEVEVGPDNVSLAKSEGTNGRANCEAYLAKLRPRRFMKDVYC